MHITSVTHKTARPMLAREDVAITVVEAEYTYQDRTRHMILSQWEGESDWYFDYVSPNGSDAWFSHGIGARECRKSVAIGELLDAIELAVRENAR